MEPITIKTIIKAPVEKVWNVFTNPMHIVKWNSPSPDWHTTKADNVLQHGGRFLSRMEAKDGSFGFDFVGKYDQIDVNRLIKYTIDDNRKVSVEFEQNDDQTIVTQSFDPEQTNPLEMQRDGWQSILDNFRNYVEDLAVLERIHYEIEIDVDPITVHKTMLDEENYRVWTAPFSPTSRYEGTWEKGTKLLFIGDSDGERGGMVSMVEENIPGELVSLRHVGLVHGDLEITEGPHVQGWAGAHEIYTFADIGGKTKLGIDVDVNREFKDHFDQSWPIALAKLKELSENRS